MKSFFSSVLPFFPRQKFHGIDYLVGGIFLYTITNSLLFLYLPQFIWWILDLIAVCLFVYGVVKKHRLGLVDGDIAICAICMLVYATIMLFISAIANDLNYPHLITQSGYFLPYLLPILVLIGVSKKDFVRIYKFLYLGCFIAFLFLLFKSKDFIFNPVETRAQMGEMVDDATWGGIYFWLSMLTVGVPFYVAISIYYMLRILPEKLHYAVVVLTIFLSIAVLISFGRRQLTVYGIVYLLSPFLVNIIKGKGKTKNVLLLSVVFGIIFVTFSQIIEMFPLLKERIYDDTRSGLLDDFKKDFSVCDWIFGRGLDATYRSPSDLGGQYIRSVAESGALNIILHFGLIYLFLYVYILFVALYRGVFLGKNIVVKGAGFFLLIQLLSLIPGNILLFSLDKMMIFILIFICGCSRWRNMNIGRDFFRK